jgi:phosphoribosylformylglycinamidine synthase
MMGGGEIMLIMRGAPALSHFRLERLLAKINDIAPQVNSVSAEYLYFMDLENRLTKPENNALSELLSYKEVDLSANSLIAVSTPGSTPKMLTAKVPGKKNQSLILVLPKSGVISTWSKKSDRGCSLLQILISINNCNTH